MGSWTGWEIRVRLPAWLLGPRWLDHRLPVCTLAVSLLPQVIGREGKYTAVLV